MECFRVLLRKDALEFHSESERLGLMSGVLLVM